jgi:hypothetical protein
MVLSCAARRESRLRAATGRARIALAKAHRAHKEETARQLADRNDELQRRLHATRPRTVDDSRSPSPQPVRVDEQDAQDVHDAAMHARAMAAYAREMAQKKLSSDQLHFRRQLAAKSRRNPPASRSPDSSNKYTPTIGRRTTALYRLTSVAGQQPPDLDYATLTE